MLNQISLDLMVKGIDYKEIIAPLTLKQFTGSMGRDIKLVMHHTEKSKIGLVPKDQPFEFTNSNLEERSEQLTPPSSAKRNKISRAKFAVLNFLDALNKLDEKEIESVVIPVSVLARLVGVLDED